MKGFFIMIIDSIKNAGKYYSVHPSFEKAFAALAAIDDSTPNERITVDGDNIFINLSEYTNKNVNDCPFEAHKKYIDIQYMDTYLDKDEKLESALLRTAQTIVKASGLKNFGGICLCVDENGKVSLKPPKMKY